MGNAYTYNKDRKTAYCNIRSLVHKVYQHKPIYIQKVRNK